MITLTERQAYKSLASAILLRAIIDMKKNIFDLDFFMSEWCFDLCDIAGITYLSYFKKAMETGSKIEHPIYKAPLLYRL